MYPKHITPDELATEMRVSTRTVYSWLRRGEVPGAFKVGKVGTWFINPKIFFKYLEELATEDYSDFDHSDYTDRHGIV